MSAWNMTNFSKIVLFSVPNAHSAEAAYKQAQSNTTNTSSKLKTPLLPPLGATVLDPYDLRDRIVGETIFPTAHNFK